MKRILILLSLAALSFSSFAEDMEQDKSSGCGFGWEVTKSKTLWGSSIRGTTNAFASNSIAMTMGTSGCEKHGIVLNSKNQENFANVNYENIMIDMAAGQGEYLSAFADVMGCDAQALGNVGQQNLEGLAGDNAAAFLNNVRGAIATDSKLQSACI